MQSNAFWALKFGKCQDPIIIKHILYCVNFMDNYSNGEVKQMKYMQKSHVRHLPKKLNIL